MPEPPISARGKNVIIIGGGDTGADCLGTAHRQGAASVTQLEILPRPTESRPDHQPWPTYPMIYRVSSAHEEGGERVYAVSTQEFVGDEAGRVTGLRLVEVELADGKFAPVPGTERELPCELVLLAMGFTGADRQGLLTDLGVEFDARGNVARDGGYATSVPGVFVAGDMGRGQSLIVWAIAEGRSAAAAVDTLPGGGQHAARPHRRPPPAPWPEPPPRRPAGPPGAGRPCAQPGMCAETAAGTAFSAHILASERSLTIFRVALGVRLRTRRVRGPGGANYGGGVRHFQTACPQRT